MKIFFYTCIFLMLPLLVFSQNQNTRDYIEKYKAIAIKEMKRTNIPASITLAQAILESSSGESTLASKFNNHFGIKCKSDWKGETTYKDDDKKNECFRAYPTAESSFIDHSNFLKNRPNYASLFELDPVDDTAWAYGLKKAGYATERDYPKRLLKIIDDYELAQFNYPELDNDAVSEEKESAPIKDTSIVTSTDTSKNKVILGVSEKDTLAIEQKKDSVIILKSSEIKTNPIISSDTISLSPLKGISSDTVLYAPIASLKGISDLNNDSSLQAKSDTVIIAKDTSRPIIDKDVIRPLNSKDTIITKLLNDKKENNLKQDTVSSITKQDTITTKKVNPYPLNQKFKINQVPAIWAEKGRSFLEIANTYNVSLYKIYKFNKLEETDLVEKDQLIYLAEPKKDTTSTKPIIKNTKPSLKGILDLPFLKKKTN